MSGRVNCCVPFCRATRPEGKYKEWVCGKHWTFVDRQLRRLLATARRRKRWQAFEYLWAKCKRQAIERAMGI